MRVLAVALTCLVCTGHGRRVTGPAYQAGLSATGPRDSLAALLLVRGGRVRRGRSDFDDMRGGFGESLPMTPSRSRSMPPTTATAEIEDLDAYMGEAANIGMGQTRRGSANVVRRGVAKSDTVLVQGGSLKTWSYRSALVDRVQVVLTTDGRPLDADVQLWQGPDNTPCKMRVYSEDGNTRPFSAVIATPGGGDNTVAVRNVGQIEFPLAAHVSATDVAEPVSNFLETSMIVQGGALRTYNFDASVESVEIMLKTDGRPLNARIELLQGPNNNKQVIELYTEDGLERPFFAVIDTMGSGNVVRVVNTAPMEFPMTASVQPHSINEKMSLTDPVIGGGRRF
mmetsp:Transcript_29453/g.54276  ORF Transcript_29453/g.54276 Transcript_29453/m.54276 type:complete len:340 (-) Transcript_29453:354-1373(-)